MRAVASSVTHPWWLYFLSNPPASHSCALRNFPNKLGALKSSPQSLRLGKLRLSNHAKISRCKKVTGFEGLLGKERGCKFRELKQKETNCSLPRRDAGSAGKSQGQFPAQMWSSYTHCLLPGPSMARPVLRWWGRVNLDAVYRGQPPRAEKDGT